MKFILLLFTFLVVPLAFGRSITIVSPADGYNHNLRRPAISIKGNVDSVEGGQE